MGGREKKREAKEEGVEVRDSGGSVGGAVGKTKLPTTAVKICPLLYRVAFHLPALPLLRACAFLSAPKLILGHQFPEII